MSFFRQNILTLLTAFVILVLSAVPVNSLPKVEIPNIDKPVHFAMYAILTVAILMDRRNSITKPLWFLLAPLIAMVYGGAMEIMQHFLGYRSCSLYDFIANDIGSVIGLLIFALFHRLLRKQ